MLYEQSLKDVLVSNAECKQNLFLKITSQGTFNFREKGNKEPGDLMLHINLITTFNTLLTLCFFHELKPPVFTN